MQLITLKLESRNCLQFQPDTGAQCKVIPLNLYKEAPLNKGLNKVQHGCSAISAYGGSRLQFVGQVIIPSWREGERFKLNCKLVDSWDICPILRRKACLGMNIIQYIDNKINNPEVGNAHIYTMTSTTSGLNTEELCKQFLQVFADEVDQLEGKYHIKLDAAVTLSSTSQWL